MPVSGSSVELTEEKRIRKLAYRSREITQTETQKEVRIMNQTEHPRTMRQYQMVHEIGILEEKS